MKRVIQLFSFNSFLFTTAALFFLTAIAHSQYLPSTDQTFYNYRTDIPLSYFGLNILNMKIGATYPSVRFGSWRSATGLWRRLEPHENVWFFDDLDKEVALAEQHQIDFDILLGNPPAWASARPAEVWKNGGRDPGSLAEPRDAQEWTSYIRTIAKRYQGRVKTYELWNEPNQADQYSGNVQNLVLYSCLAYKALKELDPTSIVISPSMAPASGVEYLRTFLSAGGGECFDVLGFHFYTEDKSPEYMAGQVKRIRAALSSYGLKGKQVWNTESGYKIVSGPKALHPYLGQDSTTEVLQAARSQAYIARCFILGWIFGINRYYWYAWGHDYYSIADNRGRLDKPSTIAYRMVETWLVGYRVLSADRTPTGIWTVVLVDHNLKKEVILWGESTSTYAAIDPQWLVHYQISIDGIKTLAPKEIRLGEAPVALVY